MHILYNNNNILCIYSHIITFWKDRVCTNLIIILSSREIIYEKEKHNIVKTQAIAKQKKI